MKSNLGQTLEGNVLRPAPPWIMGQAGRTLPEYRAFREAFYARVNLLADGLSTMGLAFQKAVHKHTTYKSHARLNGRTPWEYTQLYLADPPSHIL
jgi:transposase InsO family protein